ncbi:MAG: LD-carboxypeptidase [Bacteroidetes bacterium]|nr:LD-carboxypeptidase [Bacteroidota bacterium]
MIQPPFLQAGDRIGLFAPARKLTENEALLAAKLLSEKGFEAVFAPNLLKEDNQFSGTDAERAADLDSLLMDESIKAILAFRGGYGSVRLLPYLRKSYPTPKWIIGYSDITVLHHWVNQKLGWMSMHGTMPVNMLQAGMERIQSKQSLVNALLGNPETLIVPDTETKVQGELCGGNLSVIYSLLGSDLQTISNKKLLFLEDLDEYLYHIDRMMQAINRSGIGPGSAAWLIGGMSDMRNNTIPFGKDARQIIREAHEGLNSPLVFDIPAGHEPLNRTIIMGMEYRLDAGRLTPLL